MPFRSRAQSRERDGFSRKGKRFFFVPFEGNEGKPSLHGEMCATARTHLLGEKRATARPLLLQWSGMCEGAAYGKAVPSRPSLLRSASWLQSLKCFAKKLKVSSFKTSAGASGRRTSERGASGRRLRAAQRHSCAKSVDAYGKAVPLCPSYLRSANCPKSLKCCPNSEKPKAGASSRRLSQKSPLGGEKSCLS